MRLDIALMDRRGLVAALDDDVGLAKGGVHVSELEDHALGDVGGRRRLRVDARGEHVVMQDGRAFDHRVLDLDDMRQHLVIDLDGCKRGIGRSGAGRGDRCNGVAVIQRLVARQRVAGHVAEVRRAFADERFLACDLRHVDGGHHRLDARDRFRLGDVDRTDAGMGVRAAQHLADKLARKLEVGPELGAAGDLIHTVRADRAGADDLEGRGSVRCHVRTLLACRRPCRARRG